MLLVWVGYAIGRDGGILLRDWVAIDKGLWYGVVEICVLVV